jgi:hypothetical protein
LPLVALSHDGERATSRSVQKLFPRFNAAEPIDGCGSLGGVFSKCYEDWAKDVEAKQNEAALASKIAAELAEALPKEKFSVQKDQNDPDPLTNGCVRCDVTVGSLQGAKQTVLMVELGLNNEDWWRKFDRGLRYMRNLESLAGPALLAVVTLAGPGQGGTPKTGPKTGDFARLGAFLVTKRPGRTPSGAEFRISLLWHERAKGLRAASGGFGRIVRAACLLPEWIEESKAMKEAGSYGYLGPNCCKIVREKSGEVRPFGFVLRTKVLVVANFAPPLSLLTQRVSFPGSRKGGGAQGLRQPRRVHGAAPRRVPAIGGIGEDNGDRVRLRRWELPRPCGPRGVDGDDDSQGLRLHPRGERPL